MSSGNEKITINLPGMSNQEIKTSLISIYDKINKPPTKEVGYDLFLKLVHKNLYSSPQMNYIINHVSEFILPLEPKEKDPCIKLLSLIFYSPSNEEESIDSKIYFPYLSPVLTTLQNLIKDSNSTIFPTIANVFAEIVQNIMPTDIEASNIELDQEEKTAYEMMQGFCIYNMKYDDKSNRIVGSLCLTKLVENCPVVLQKQYMKLIWEVIMNLIDKKNFNAKYELLNCLISLILGAENLFSPYAHNTLYKVLDFLADTDWFKRKLALNVIYTLIFYCKEEILPLKEHIISFLRALKTDKVKEVREVCLLILKIFSENEQKNKDNTKDKNSKGNNSSINLKKKLGNKPNENKSSNKTKNNKANSNVSMNNNTNNNSSNNNNNNNTNKLKNSIQKKIGTKFNKNIDPDKNSNKFSDCMIPEIRDNNANIKENKNKFNENMKSLESNKNEEIKKNNEIIQDQDNNNFLAKKTGMNSTMKNNLKESNSETVTSSQNTKLVNRKDDKTFINEKMVIKPDPNKSIFKSSPNPAFFSQANKKSKDIVVVSKGDPSKFKNNSTNNKNEEIIINIKEKKDTKEIKETNNTNDIIVQVPKEKKAIKEIKETSKNDIIVQVPKEKKIEVKNDTVNKNNNNDIDNNNEDINNEITINIVNKKEIKDDTEKPNTENSIKNKAAPIKRNKVNKKINEKEKEKEIKPEEKIESNNEKINIKYKIKEDTKEKNIIYKDNTDEKQEDIEIKDYKTYLNRSEKNKEKMNYDPNIINSLLSQMNSLSEKQLSLIDVMDNIQMETQGQIKQLNKRISKLEKNLEELNNELYYLKNE